MPSKRNEWTPKRVRAEWVKRLRSGEYKQGMAALRTEDDRFCCLGVLCDLYADVTGEGAWEWEPPREGMWGHIPGSWRFVTESEDADGVLPEEVQAWAGFIGEYDYNPTLDGDRATWRNDDQRNRFSTIARAIERTP